MRPRTPPLLPTYFLLVLVVVFAVGSLWVGLERLDSIEALAESRATSAATVQDLQAMRMLVSDVVNSAQSFARTGDAANLELYERARRGIPAQLTSLRDRMRDTPSELALVEQLVPLLGRTTTEAEAVIERAKSAPEAPRSADTTPAYRAAQNDIRRILAELEAGEQGQVADDGRALRAAIGAARVLDFALGTLSVLLAALLFMAARRLAAFIPPAPRTGAASAVEFEGGDSIAAATARVGMLLRDALTRARLAVASASADDPAAADRIRAAIAVLERLPLATEEPPRPGAVNPAAGLALLAQAYSQRTGLAVVPMLDQSVAIRAPTKAFVIDRAAAWALDAIATRKRAGQVGLTFAASGPNATLRIVALLDHPDLTLRLSPREREEAEFLRRAASASDGEFAVNHGTTGLAVVLTLPLDA